MNDPGAPETGDPRAGSEAEAGPSGRRTFTDVASLFQPIVPRAGAPARAPAPLPPAPPPIRLDPEAAAPPQPPATIEPAPAPRPRPTNPPAVPWPEALKPQPNWRRRSLWSWLLLVPFGVATAGFMLLVDPGSIRSLLNRHVLQHLAELSEVIAPSSPTPPPPPVSPPAAPSAPLPSPAPSVSRGDSEPSLPPSSPVPAAEPSPPPAPERPIPEPAAPRFSSLTEPRSEPAPEPAPVAPAPEPPQTAATPAPAPPAALAPAPSFGHVVIRYRRRSPSETESARIAAELQGVAAQVELRSGASRYRVPTVIYFRPEDREAALALAQRLGGERSSWSVRVGQSRTKAGILEAWIP